MGFFGAFHGAFGTVAYGFIGLWDLGGLEGLRTGFLQGAYEAEAWG